MLSLDRAMNYEQFKTIISRIAQQVDLTSSGALSTNDDFTFLASNADSYRDFALRLLNDDVPVRDKRVTVYLIQKLSFEHYLWSLRFLLAKAKIKQVDPALFEDAIIPGFEWNTRLQENYRRPGVRALIIDVKQAKVLPSRCDDYLNEILSGRGNKHVQEMRRDGEIP